MFVICCCCCYCFCVRQRLCHDQPIWLYFLAFPVWLIEDTDERQHQFPVHLVALFDQISDSQQSAAANRSSILFNVIYGVALEMGFVSCAATAATSKLTSCHASWAFSFNRKFVNAVAATITDGHHLPAHIYNGDIGCYQLRIELFQLSVAEPCLLLAREIGDILCVTVHVARMPGAGGHSVALAVPRYVQMVAGRRRSPLTSLRNLQELSVRLKGELFGPLRNDLVPSDAIRVWPGLCGVPEEVRRLIWCHVPRSNWQDIARTCTKFRRELINEYYHGRRRPI